MAKKKDDDVDAVAAAIKKELGDTVQMLSDSSALCQVNFSVSTRSIVIDKILAGGRPMPCSMVPFGRQAEISGLNGSGKTTLCAHIAAETQRMGGLVVVVDTEERMDLPYWESLGVDVSKVMKIKAKTLEEVFNRQEAYIKAYIKTGTSRPMLMIWDSVGGTSSGDVIEGKEDFMTNAKKSMGREAKLIGMGVKGLNPLIAECNVCYLYTNHLYRRLDVTYGDPWQEPGGEKLKFQATVRLRLTKVKEIKEEDQFGNKAKIGQVVKVKANKNSMAPMQMEKEAVLIGGVGFCNDYTVFDIAKRAKLINGKGWYTVTLGGEEVKFQGWGGFQLKVVMHEHYNELVDAVMELL